MYISGIELDEKLYISRIELYEKLWSIGQMKTCNELNITHSKLIVVCADYNIPIPPKEYWQGKMMKIPLPNREQDVLVCLAKKPNPILENAKKRAEQNKKPAIPSLPDYFKFYRAEECSKLQAAFDALHMEPVLSPTPHAEITKYWAYQAQKGMKKLQPALKFKTSLREIDKEVFIFIDQLLKAFEHIGARIYSDSEATKIEYNGYTFSLKFKLPSFKNNIRANGAVRNQMADASLNEEPKFIWKGFIIIELGVTGKNQVTGNFNWNTITQHLDESFNTLLKRTFVEMVRMAGVGSVTVKQFFTLSAKMAFTFSLRKAAGDFSFDSYRHPYAQLPLDAINGLK